MMEKDNASTNASSTTGSVKHVAEWIASMQPRPPAIARAKQCGAGFRAALLQQLRPMAATEALDIAPPGPVTQPAVSKEESSAQLPGNESAASTSTSASPKSSSPLSDSDTPIPADFQVQSSQLEDLAEDAAEGGRVSEIAADAGSAAGELPALPTENVQDQADAETVDLGEEDAQEFVLCSQEARLCEFQDGEWKDKGMGHAKLLSGEVTGRTRFVFSSDAGLKANFYIVPEDPYCDLLLGVAENSVVWTCLDGAAGEEALKQFSLEFSSAHLFEGFRKTFEKARYANAHQFSMGQMSVEYLENAEAAEAASEAAPAGPSPEGTAGSPDNGHKQEAEDGSLGFVSKASPSKAPSSLFPSSWAQSESAAELPAKPAAAAPTTKKTSAGESRDNGEAAAADSAADGTADEDAAGAERPVAAEEADIPSPDEVVYTARAKFYNFRNNKWKRKAVGDILMSRKKDTGVVTFEMQQQSDLQVVARFEISDEGDYCILTPNFDSDRCWQWQALDTSQDGVQVEEQFGVKFPDAAAAAEFASAFEDAKASPLRAIRDKQISQQEYRDKKWPNWRTAEEIMYDPADCEEHSIWDGPAPSADDLIAAHVEADTDRGRGLYALGVWLKAKERREKVRQAQRDKAATAFNKDVPAAAAASATATPSGGCAGPAAASQTSSVCAAAAEGASTSAAAGSTAPNSAPAGALLATMAEPALPMAANAAKKPDHRVSGNCAGVPKHEMMTRTAWTVGCTAAVLLCIWLPEIAGVVESGS